MSDVKRYSLRDCDFSDENTGLRQFVLATDYDAAIRKRDEVLRTVSEWVCESCLMCYPGPPQPGLKCVICPKCGGSTMPHETHERRKAERERDEARAELALAEWRIQQVRELCAPQAVRLLPTKAFLAESVLHWLLRVPPAADAPEPAPSDVFNLCKFCGAEWMGKHVCGDHWTEDAKLVEEHRAATGQGAKP